MTGPLLRFASMLLFFAPAASAEPAPPIHSCAVQLKLNTYDAGYSGTGTGTLVKRDNSYYMVTARHNLQRANNKLTIAFEPNLFFSKNDFVETFISIAAADFVVAKFKTTALTPSHKSRFRELLHQGDTVQNPIPGESLAAVGNPVFAYESSQRLQVNIVYEGMVAEYATPAILVGDVTEITARMMILESLSIMPGFSGGPLLLIRDRDTGDAEIGGIVVGGDPRAIVSPGRFVFGVPAVAINNAITWLEQALIDPMFEAPAGTRLLETDLRSVPRDRTVGFRYAGARVVVIDVTHLTYLEQVDNAFLKTIARHVKNADMVFHGGTFGDVDLHYIQPSRATFVGCRFNHVESLSRANLMGARFIDCEVVPPDGGEAEPVRVMPTLGYGITVIDGPTIRAPKVVAADPGAPAELERLDGIFQLRREAIVSDAVSSRERRQFAAPVEATSEADEPKKGIRLSRDRFGNLLTHDLFADE